MYVFSWMKATSSGALWFVFSPRPSFFFYFDRKRTPLQYDYVIIVFSSFSLFSPVDAHFLVSTSTRLGRPALPDRLCALYRAGALGVLTRCEQLCIDQSLRVCAEEKSAEKGGELPFGEGGRGPTMYYQK